ncbi:MAG: zinc ribbon domain-containing protein [Haloarculaceae archaeon]
MTGVRRPPRVPVSPATRPTPADGRPSRRNSAVPGSDGYPECGHDAVEVDGVAMTGDGLGKFFDIQTNKFTAVPCPSRGYTGCYRVDRSRGDDIVDVFRKRLQRSVSLVGRSRKHPADGPRERRADGPAGHQRVRG